MAQRCVGAWAGAVGSSSARGPHGGATPRRRRLLHHSKRERRLVQCFCEQFVWFIVSVNNL
uniref:Uncharacterized protein n=1 Tax=Arundo donax TaxID=35708 RepID=A0A0A9AHD8_ARUDO